MPTLKELAKMPDRITGGHRLCPGCGAPIAVRQILRGTDQPVAVVCATGCLEVATTIYPHSAWKCPYFHNAFENAAATLSGIETAYRALKKKGKIKKEMKFVAFGGDGGTYDIGLQSLSGAMERGHDFVYVCYDNEAYMNCLSLDSLIMTRDGLKRITDIKVGDPVYAFNIDEQKLVLKRCTGVFDNGVKDVFELNTMHHTIKATSNHPFLVLKRNGRGKENNFVWKTLEKLKNGDEVVVLKNLDSGDSFKFKQIKLSKKGDYKVNKINNLKIPKKSSSELMEFLGLFVGDGWIRAHKAETGFALPAKTKGRTALLRLCKKLFGSYKLSEDKMYAYIYSVNLARFIESLGFGSGAKNKLIPAWVFTLPKEEKESFVKGLMLSDGYKLGNSYRYVSASYDLLRTLRLLLQTIDYRVGKIHQQTKKKGEFCVYRKLMEDSTYGYICFSKKPKADTVKYISQIRQRDFLANNDNFSTEKIVSIKHVKKEPTLDLRVEGEHNFIADGIVVHNTGIQRSSATPLGAATTTSNAGKIHQGKEEFKKNILDVVAAHGIPYAAQTCVSEWNDVLTKAKKAFETKGPAFINILAPCQRGWRHPHNMTIQIARSAVETRFWPLLEVENGRKWTLNRNIKQPKPITEWLKTQGRFKHLFKPENKRIIDKIQQHVNSEWDRIKKLCEMSGQKFD